MPVGNRQNPKHPLLTKGDRYAGQAFIKLLDYALTSVKVTIGRGKVKAPPHKIETMKAARGFPTEVRVKIEAGLFPVSIEQIRQLLIDLYPTPLSRGDPGRILMQKIVDGTWSPDLDTPVTSAKVAKAVDMEHTVADHGDRILLLCDACGVTLSQRQRSLLRGQTKVPNLAPAMLTHLAKELRLPEKLLLGQLHFDRSLTPVKDGEEWRQPPGPFLPGDVRAGILWRNMVRKYRAIRFWFESEYGLTDELVRLISNGKLGVPIPVHLTLMRKAAERLASVNDPVVPRFYTALLELEASIPAELTKLGETETPCKDWFRQL